ncbi:MAG: hypothetical protein ACTSR8_02490 [Promethearchaeota archaeon]
MQAQFTENLEEIFRDYEKEFTAINIIQKNEPSNLELRTLRNRNGDLKGDTKGFITPVCLI